MRQSPERTIVPGKQLSVEARKAEQIHSCVRVSLDSLFANSPAGKTAQHTKNWAQR